MLVRRTIFFSLIALVLSGCASAPRVNTDFDTKASFANLNTFAFAPENNDNQEITTLLSKRVRDALTVAFKQQGKSLVEEGEAVLCSANNLLPPVELDVDESPPP